MGRIAILTGVECRRVWTDEDKLRFLEEVETSGSGAEIAQGHDVLSQHLHLAQEACSGNEVAEWIRRDNAADGADRAGYGGEAVRVATAEKLTAKRPARNC